MSFLNMPQNMSGSDLDELLRTSGLTEREFFELLKAFDLMAVDSESIKAGEYEIWDIINSLSDKLSLEQRIDLIERLDAELSPTSVIVTEIIMCLFFNYFYGNRETELAELVERLLGNNKMFKFLHSLAGRISSNEADFNKFVEQMWEVSGPMKTKVLWLILGVACKAAYDANRKDGES